MTDPMTSGAAIMPGPHARPLYAYAVFGGILESDLEFPELRAAPPGVPTWTLRTSDGPTPDDDATLIGDEDFPLYASSLRLLRTAAGFRLAYTDSGTFDITADGAGIVWYPGENPPLDLVRMDVVGRVLATALHAAGAIALHASAVAIDGVGVAFLAPKFFGKSTLALALTYAGGKLITDDTLGVLPGAAPLCIPGVHSVRLRSESAARFPRSHDAQPDEGGRVVNELPDDKLMVERVPLAALYLLAPVDRDKAAVPVRRVLLPSFQGTMAAIGHAKMGSLLRQTEAAANFERAAEITRIVPVYQLEIVRDLDQIDGVTRQILAWHSADAGTPDHV